MAPPLPQPM
uniref:Uncharacterized protein n=1 Tax=Arundo donax TaxID=35708 RepID=A0A0A9BA45_ARUDO